MVWEDVTRPIVIFCPYLWNMILLENLKCNKLHNSKINVIIIFITTNHGFLRGSN